MTAGEREIFLGGTTVGGKPTLLRLDRMNRHGLVAGATGTGKTVTLKVMAEQFSRAGVPVFAADVKGDLSGILEAGKPKSFLSERAKAIGIGEPDFEGSPTIFWDLFGQSGHPVRATVSEMGPMLLSRLLDLTEAQEGALNVAFRLADDRGMLVLDLKDLRALLDHCAGEGKDEAARYGAVAKATVGAIQRKLLTLENEGADRFFAEPALELADLMRTGRDGRGIVNVLAAEKLIQSPRLYATFLLWLMSELFEELPEIGDPERPRLVFFFDEAHLLFSDAPKALVDKVTQVVRLIRSKGVGIFFVTQSPADIPDAVLAQLGTRIQHALRAFTPGERKAIRAVADGFRPNPALDTAQAVTELATGEALVSTLDAKGAPTVVERVLVRPPLCELGPASAEGRARTLRESPVGPRYDKAVDRDSAYEILSRRAEQAAVAPAEAAPRQGAWGGSVPRTGQRTAPAEMPPPSTPRSRSDSVGTAIAKSVVRTVGSEIGRQLVRGLLGSLFKGGRR